MPCSTCYAVPAVWAFSTAMPSAYHPAQRTGEAPLEGDGARPPKTPGARPWGETEPQHGCENGAAWLAPCASGGTLGHCPHATAPRGPARRGAQTKTPWPPSPWSLGAGPWGAPQADGPVGPRGSATSPTAHSSPPLPTGADHDNAGRPGAGSAMAPGRQARRWAVARGADPPRALGNDKPRWGRRVPPYGRVESPPKARPRSPRRSPPCQPAVSPPPTRAPAASNSPQRGCAWAGHCSGRPPPWRETRLARPRRLPACGQAQRPAGLRPQRSQSTGTVACGVSSSSRPRMRRPTRTASRR
jgi:hypothetical protein